MAISKKLKGIYMGFFDGMETGVANLISDFQERRYLRQYCTKDTPPHSLVNEVKTFWKQYRKVSPKWAWYYASQNGIEDPRYIPNDLYYTKIDQYFNNRKLGWGFNDKNYYSMIFAGVRQPEVIVRNIGGILEDERYNLLSLDESFERICANSEVVCKPTLETGSGRSIQFWNTTADIGKIKAFLTDKSEKDWIVQKVIKQHAELNRVHSTSINSLRIVSILMPEDVYILSSNLRMGSGGSRIDNVTAGGISVGVNADGTLKKYATTYYTGERIEQHPQGLVFDGFVVPGYHKAIDMIKSIHPLIPHFRLVSWDVAICEDGEPMLIEANMRKGGINLNQFNNGPLFGDLTERVLDEVFRK